MTRHPAALIEPSESGVSGLYRYGPALPFQVDAHTAALSCCLRVESQPAGDFENGFDLIFFESLSSFSDARIMPVARNDKYLHPETREPRIAIRYPMIIGFVPLGAKREDGSPHPHAGTGFGLNQVLDFPMLGYAYYSKNDKTTRMVPYHEIRQFHYDGRTFNMMCRDCRSPDQPLRAPGSEWALTWPGWRNAIPDGDDLLVPILASSGDLHTWFPSPMASGVSRWARGEDGLWQPVSFIPVAPSETTESAPMVYGKQMQLHWMEPSLVRDIDGSLLFTARGVYQSDAEHMIRIWRSTDGGESWGVLFEQRDVRGQAPVTLNLAADGTPYVVGNAIGRERDALAIWPLNDGRTALEQPISVRDALSEFGPPPSGLVWFMDHPTAEVVRLRDGQWHNLLVYRIMDRGEHAGQAPSEPTGLYVEEVVSTGSQRGTWRF